MLYSLTALASVADCDALLDLANLEQEDLDLKKMQQDRQYRIVTSGSTGVEVELAGVISQITGLETAVAVMPEGAAKQDLVDKLTDLQHKKFLLEKRRRRYGTLALLQKEYAISAIEKQIAENTDYMAAISQRKSELAAKP